MGWVADEPVDQQFQALADPTRRAILGRIRGRRVPAGEIAGWFEMSRPAVSRHLRVLREARLVTVHAEGTSRFYETDLEALAGLRAYFETFWEDGLARLKEAAEREHGKSKPRKRKR